MTLFTFYLNYRGGTYISQVYAPTPEKAPGIWAEQLIYNEIEGIGPKGKDYLIQQIESDVPVPVTGIKRTWCSSARVNGSLALIHFTETTEEIQES